MATDRHTLWVMSAAFSPDGSRIVTASADYTASISTARPASDSWCSPRERFESAQFSHDGQRMVTASQDHTAQIWNADTGATIGFCGGTSPCCCQPP